MNKYKLVSPGNNTVIRTYKNVGGLELALEKLAAAGTYPYVTIMQPDKGIKFRVTFSNGDWEPGVETPIHSDW